MAVYTVPGVTDNGNGMTYSFDPATAGVGIHTITYSYTNDNGCTVFAEDDIAMGTIPGGPGAIQGLAVICPLLKNLIYCIGKVNTAISYTLSFSDAPATIANNGSNMVMITYCNLLFTVGISMYDQHYFTARRYESRLHLADFTYHASAYKSSQ